MLGRKLFVRDYLCGPGKKLSVQTRGVRVQAGLSHAVGNLVETRSSTALMQKGRRTSFLHLLIVQIFLDHS
jgi:hypothetical protein